MVKFVTPGGLLTRPPFSTLFTMDPTTRDAITSDMRQSGFDESKPIDVWHDGTGFVVVDGHTRLAVARTLGIDEVPIYPHIFDDQLSALAYAIHNQRDRRNLTGIDMLNAIKAVDVERRQPHGGDRGNQHTGGKFSLENLPPAVNGSARETAKIIGTSPIMVNRARAIYDDPEATKQVEEGVGISTVADRVWEEKRKNKPSAPPSWAGLAQGKRQDDEPWFIAMDHGSICQSIAGRAASDIQQRLDKAREQGLDIPALMRENAKVRTEWNKALDEARAVTRLIRDAIRAAKVEEDEAA